jgi:hypothetical protein
LGRFESGQSVWISPCLSGEFVIEDEAIVMDDLGDGYIVLQVAERVPSYGSGHFVQDNEVLEMMN